MGGQTFCGVELRIIRSARRSIAVQIKPDGITVRAPMQMSGAEINAFLVRKRAWIEKHLAEIGERQRGQAALPKLSNGELRALAEKAKAVIPKRAAFYAPLVGVGYGRITIRAQRTRWGSCSSKGNLNFNCLLMLMPDEVIDSVVVHELCHLTHMNHSKDFWNMVERIMPDYRVYRTWLKDHGQELTLEKHLARRGIPLSLDE